MVTIEHVLQINDIGGQPRFKFLLNGTGNEENYDLLLNGSHLIIGVVDPLRYERSLKYIYSVISSLENYNKIFVATKKDLMDEEMDNNLKTWEPFINDTIVRVSNRTGENIETLIEKIKGVISIRENYYVKDVNKRYSKVVIVGLGGAGKSTLFERLKNNSFLENPKLTVGANIGTIRLHYDI
jgi:GTPase SAR1 family protein